MSKDYTVELKLSQRGFKSAQDAVDSAANAAYRFSWKVTDPDGKVSYLTPDIKTKEDA